MADCYRLLAVRLWNVLRQANDRPTKPSTSINLAYSSFLPCSWLVQSNVNSEQRSTTLCLTCRLNFRSGTRLFLRMHSCSSCCWCCSNTSQLDSSCSPRDFPSLTRPLGPTNNPVNRKRGDTDAWILKYWNQIFPCMRQKWKYKDWSRKSETFDSSREN